MPSFPAHKEDKKMTIEQMQELLTVVQDHPGSVYMGERFLEAVEKKPGWGSFSSPDRIKIQNSMLDAFINNDIEQLFLVMTGKTTEDVLNECYIVPQEAGGEAYIPIMPWEMTEEQKEDPFDVMDALRLAGAARDSLAQGQGTFEYPICGGTVKAFISRENGHLHASCHGSYGITIQE